MVIAGNEVLYNTVCTFIDLCEVCSESDNKGLIICYSLAVNKMVELVSISLDVQHNDGEYYTEHSSYDGESFKTTYSSLSKFLELFDSADFGVWEVVLKFDNTLVTVCGDRSDTDIGVSYNKKKSLDLKSLFTEVEQLSHETQSKEG